ncbi:MAG: acetyl-CoA carboxylase biotin carboxylase subunit [Burkholderiaceae bacterium]|jgi:acetyl-CoA carboxylase biotin carboxylase subunit|nr:acetyl-CoA carboxylase biotin carboxylase subunit [Burkholderiaceae bacterium]
MSFDTVFVANRGEIAVRVIRTCRALGLRTVVGYSEADRGSLPTRLADRAVCLGPARSADSYLRIPTVVAAALGTGAQAVHPGYGFLSENPEFGRQCAAAGLVLIGPTPAQLERIGNKLAARQAAIEAGVPVVPGEAVDTPEAAQRAAAAIGYPVLLKAVAGGGGRGMKRVDAPAELAERFALATAEASAAFGDPRLYVEAFVATGRHVEVQVLGDGERVIHLGERDCSVQRRYQKVLEEAGAPRLAPTLRTALHEAAVRFAASLGYRGLGTVECLVDPAREAFYFLEMNARIQVEHPVTEMLTGLDLVAEQIGVAQGASLRLAQSEIRFQGHAIECRINAEDPSQDFRPSPGTVRMVRWPDAPHVRVDTHVESGYRIPPFYDSLVAKLIVHGADRARACAAMREALAATRIEGIATNLALHQAILADPDFAAGGVDTNWLGRALPRLLAPGPQAVPA